MYQLSRREFLQALGVTAAGLAIPSTLTGCGITANETQPVRKSTPSPIVGAPDLVVARNAEPEVLVRRAMAALGGMEAFVSAGDWVVIKPNICTAYYSYEYATTTNPWVVGALVKMCVEVGARKVQVMDYPFGGAAKQAYEMSGIAEQVRLAGGEMVVMDFLGFVKTAIPQGVDLRNWQIYEDCLNADCLINVPIAKHHNLARLTLGMKNLMGLIDDRSAMHRNLGQRLADLASRIRPKLTVVDAVRMLMDHGPTGGNLEDVKQINTIVVSQDIVAADSYAATLFDLKPEELGYVQAGTKLGLGRSRLDELLIEELDLSV